MNKCNAEVVIFRARAIKSFCDNQASCKDCPLDDEQGRCMLSGLSPEDWSDLNE